MEFVVRIWYERSASDSSPIAVASCALENAISARLLTARVPLRVGDRRAGLLEVALSSKSGPG